MSDSLLTERLSAILDALERIPDRFDGIETPADFLATKKGIDRMDGICMVLIAVGEALKQIDRKTGGRLLSRYPQVEWRDIIGVRNVLAHGYFDHDIPVLIETVRTILKDLQCLTT